MELAEIFHQHFNTAPILISRAPGRVNLLGEHVDYNQGPVLPAAVDREVRLACAPIPDRRVELFAHDLSQSIVFSLDALEEKSDLSGRPLPTWALYPAGVAWALQNAGLEVGGLRGVYTSNVPIGSGLSSSAAVEVAFAAAWQALSGWEKDRLELAQLCQQAENGYVGVASGLMDQFASACGVEDHALYFEISTLHYDPVPLPAGTVLVVADSGLRRSLATSAYNERRESCEEAVRLLQKYLPNIHSLNDVTITEFAALSEYLPPLIRKRADHVVHEIARVHTAVTALRMNEIRSFGALMYAGHASLRDLYEVSIPELDALVEIARRLPGCYGARLTGAGFGGCTINMIDEKHSHEFIEGLHAGYQQRTGRSAQVYLCRASRGVSTTKL